jgi:hypothetical protein
MHLDITQIMLLFENFEKFQSERSEELDIDLLSDNEGEKGDKWKTSDYFHNDENEKLLLIKCRFCDLKYCDKTSTTLLKRHYNKQHLIC